MARTVGSKNQNLIVRPPTSKLDTDERMHLVANLIVDRIKDDQQSGQTLFKSIGGSNDTRALTAP